MSHDTGQQTNLLDAAYNPAPATGEHIPHVVAWNITQRCNLECAHCYISAGPSAPTDKDLTVAECRRITDEILAINPNPMFILTGGEPLSRPDLEQIAAYASDFGATVVVGTNGTGLTPARIQSLMASGVKGVAISIDSLQTRYHNRFRHGDEALEQTLAGVTAMQEAGLDFIVQTTLTSFNRGEIDDLVAWSVEHGAVSFNLYFLVETGRGTGMKGLTPEQNDEALRDLVRLQKQYRGQILIRSKCQPALMRHVHELDPTSPIADYSTRCPCGVQYCRITPDGKLTPCPYLPEVAGDLRTQSFGEIWNSSPLFQTIRAGGLGGKCGSCEFRKVCGGCRARAFADSGDVMAADESCGYQPTGDVPVIEPKAVAYGGAAPKLELRWAPEAEARMSRIPSFVRGVVMKRVEDFASREGHTEITLELLDSVRKNMPIDFSKRLPFFMRGKDKKDD
ncbi:MAG: radical SAM protein with 4Fe4S-binding SPASM domain [Myxococcota bacterium]|jgi:radical SAM protein with 4Fe4S-binding SPASM domain